MDGHHARERTVAVGKRQRPPQTDAGAREFDLAATHESTLEIIDLEDLKRYAINAES